MREIHEMMVVFAGPDKQEAPRIGKKFIQKMFFSWFC